MRYRWTLAGQSISPGSLGWPVAMTRHGPALLYCGMRIYIDESGAFVVPGEWESHSFGFGRRRARHPARRIARIDGTKPVAQRSPCATPTSHMQCRERPILGPV